MLLLAAIGFALSVVLGFIAGRFSAVVLPWLLLTAWAAYNAASMTPGAADGDVATGVLVVGAFGAFAATGVLLGVALRMAARQSDRA